MANIVIFGCRKITIDIIDYIVNNHTEHNIVGVINHDFERDRVYYKKLVSEKCKKLNIPTIRFDKKISTKVIRDMNPDIIFSLYYRLILSQEVLDIPSLGCINVHPGYLPKDRGPAPSLWNILNGDKFAGITAHYMTKEIDAGDIIDQERICIDGMTGFELNKKLMGIGTNLIVKNFESIINGTAKRTPQNHNNATYTLNFAKHLRYLHWDDPNRIVNQLRAFAAPFDGALAYSKNGKIAVFGGKILPNRNSFSAPGFYAISDSGITVQTCTLPILITDYSMVGGFLKPKGRFLSGPPLAEGEYEV